MFNSLILLFSGTVPLAVIECVRRRKGREESLDPEVIGKLAEFFLLCRELESRGDPSRFPGLMRECVDCLVYLIQHLPPDLASCLVRYRDGSLTE